MSKYIPNCVVAARRDAERPADAARVASVLASGVLDRRGLVLDVIVAEAMRLTRLDYAAITVVLRGEQHTAASAGIDRLVVSREESFCTHLVASGELLLVSDTWRDPFFTQHPAVTGPLSIRSYCGFPIRTADGAVLGALCGFGSEPRTFDRATLEAFLELAQSARRFLLPAAPPIPLVLALDAGAGQEDPLAAWIERHVPRADDEIDLHGPNGRATPLRLPRIRRRARARRAQTMLGA